MDAREAFFYTGVVFGFEIVWTGLFGKLTGEDIVIEVVVLEELVFHEWVEGSKKVFEDGGIQELQLGVRDA